MSFVEKALRKIQESRDTAQGSIRSPVHPVLGVLSPATAAIEIEPRRARRTRERVTSGKVIVMNRDAIRAAGLLPPEHQERQIAEQYRQIKRPLVANAQKGSGKGSNAHLIMVTSAMPGDGKTFTTINLAVSMSHEKDINVLLVDADVAKPHISRLFGVENEPGLLDALHDEKLDIESLIIPTDIPGLSILPAGKRSETATELLASSRMERIVGELSAYDAARIAILDSPPLLLTNESRVLAGAVGQIVLVVRAGKTSQQDLLDAISHLEPGKSIGLVLNQSLNSTTGYYYGYGDADSVSVPTGAAAS